MRTPYGLLVVLLVGSLALLSFSLRRDLRADEGEAEVLEDHACLTCHGFPDNEDGAPHVNGHGFLASRHAKADLDCTACHENHEDYPHPKDVDVLTAQCGECHDDAFEHLQGGPHAGLGGESAEDPADDRSLRGLSRGPHPRDGVRAVPRGRLG